ncbi:MAG: IclR family transcriptional regulator [Chloroflexota bacterium]|nr:MAG: IclR family transcriptional regulator [Chloroflexota bacterium]
MPKPQNAARYNIRVVDRAVRVLKMLSDGKPRTLTELSKELQINRSTTFRLLATLRSNNLVQLDDSTGNYQLGLACLELSRAYHSGNAVRQAALEEMKTLRDETMETVHLGVLDDLEVVYLEKLEGLHAIGLMSSRIGRRAPAYCTGLGKALLAFSDLDFIEECLQQIELQRYTTATITNHSELINHLQLVRQRGYALDSGEHEQEVRCVATPIFDQYGNVVAAISVSGPSGRIDPVDKNQELIQRTLKAANNISKNLGYKK